MKTTLRLIAFAMLTAALAGCGSNKTKDAAAAKTYAGNSKTINGHMFVDLGLPSGVLWAETNIGAKGAADYGDYFAWGETTTKADYSWDSYKFGNVDYDEYGSPCKNHFNKYKGENDKFVLDAEDDAASAKWGKECRMPTESEMRELCDEELVEHTWTTSTNTEGETVKGMLFKSKKNGNTIFLPAAGSRKDKQTFQSATGNYWTRTLGGGDFIASTMLQMDDQFCLVIPSGTRCYGISVRPVAEQ